MQFEFFIARRYLRSKRTVQFVSVINAISVVGITVGVAALLIVLSVFNGFTGIVESILVSFDPHLRIEKAVMTESDRSSVEKLLASTPDVAGFSPFVAGKAMLVSKSYGRVVFIKGIDEETVGTTTGLRQKIVLGNLALHDSGGVGAIVIGLSLADRLGAVVGSEIAVVSPYVMSSALSPFGRELPSRFRIVGVFESNNKDYDAHYAYVSLASAQRLLNMEGRYSGIEMRLRDIDDAESMKAELSRRLPESFQVSTWYDLHKDLYSVMKIERWVAYILLCLIIIVASFNMFGSLTMSVIEKRRDIGVLQSMGASARSVTRIFLFEGVVVGVLGTALGLCLGLSLLYLQIRYQIFPLDPTVYIIPAIPVEIHVIDLLTVSIASVILTVVASYVPARLAARVIPVEAIRWE